MASVKATFTLDRATVARLAETAERLGRPKSAVVRDAIHDFSDRADRLSESERRRLLAAFDELVPRIPAGDLDAAEKEIAALRAARRGGGRRSTS